MARIVLIGAGSLQFGLGTMGDIFQSEVLAGSEVVLHDINPTALARVEAAGQAFVAEHNLPFTLSATLERPVALQGADFIISSIEVGDRFALWEQDWRIPQQYGIRQVYGENGGPGGLFHSLRITGEGPGVGVGRPTPVSLASAPPKATSESPGSRPLP